MILEEDRMPTIYVIQAESDAATLTEQVLRYLPSNGYDCWLSRHHLATPPPDEHVFAKVMDQCQAIMAVVSPAILESPASVREIEIALAGRRTLIVVQSAALNEQDTARLPARPTGTTTLARIF
jgi:hypothetical protein